MSHLLEVHGLSRNFGGLTAVSDLGFHIDENEILGIIGPNGAGKTTTINLLSGVIAPTSGQVILEGEEVTRLSPHVLARKGVVRTFQSTTVYGAQTVYENAVRGAYLGLYPGFLATFFNTGRARAMRAQVSQRINELLEWLNLSDVAHLQAGSLPYGYQKTLGMVISLAAQPRLVMLDEPVAGLSAEEADHVRDTILKIRSRGITVIVIDHNMRFMKGLCDRVMVMDQGRHLTTGLPLEVLADPRVIEAYLGKGHAAAHRI